MRNVCRVLLFWRFRTVIVLDFKVVNSLKNTEDASNFNVPFHVSQNALYPEFFVSEQLIYGRQLVNADVVEGKIYSRLWFEVTFFFLPRRVLHREQGQYELRR